MSTQLLEKKVSELQQRVAEIEAKMNAPENSGWRKIAGAAKDDQYLTEAFRLGAKWRKKANREEW